MGAFYHSVKKLLSNIANRSLSGEKLSINGQTLPPCVLRVCSNPGQRSPCGLPFLPPKEPVPLPLVLFQWIMAKC